MKTEKEILKILKERITSILPYANALPIETYTNLQDIRFKINERIYEINKKELEEDKR